MEDYDDDNQLGMEDYNDDSKLEHTCLWYSASDAPYPHPLQILIPNSNT